MIIRRLRILWLLLSLAVLMSDSAVAQTKRIVQIEVAAGPRAPVETQQRWMELLSEVGADRVRSRTARGSGTIEITESETSFGVLVKVHGLIDGNQLKLPGRSFSRNDKQLLVEYVQKIRDDGADVALAEKKAFGLTSQQLVDLNQALSVPLEISTTGEPAQYVVDFASKLLAYPLNLDPSARRELQRAEPLADELKGLSLGTAIAAAIRPLGLVLVPTRKQGHAVELSIVDSRAAEEHWPIGWPAQQMPKRMIPKLFEKNPLEIRNFRLDQVLNAIESKAEAQMLFDYNSLARAGIELAETNVTFVKEKASYAIALRKLLNQTDPRMAYEIRTDEAGTVFLWISTANPAK